jgi:uncharacterized protein (UPF0276 family)
MIRAHAFPSAGVGLKPEHYEEAEADTRDGLWFEVHPENYMVAGGPRLKWLDRVRQNHPMSLHGVGLSVGGREPVDEEHLSRLAELVRRCEPFLVSEHLAWSRYGQAHFPDLLPFPRTQDSLNEVCANIDKVQTRLGRSILIENPSHYVALRHDIGEIDFLADMVRRTGCGLLIDVNNIHVSAHNLGFDAAAYIDALPVEAIGEIHIAGFSEDEATKGELWIDSHDTSVSEPVWSLLRRLLDRTGPLPILLERDGEVPDYETLMFERDRAQAEGQRSKVLAHA